MTSHESDSRWLTRERTEIRCRFQYQSDNVYDMKARRLLHRARRKAGLSQRELAERTGIAQPTIARIESGSAFPRSTTLTRLLDACGYQLELIPHGGHGVDRAAMRELLALEPEERLRRAADEANALDRLLEARR